MFAKFDTLCHEPWMFHVVGQHVDGADDQELIWR